ncbi:hypothetical protein M3Y99_01341300 [Aphelenchoides fujianensis]|nr:hypothetical protein M3Y99_01341300 [Aphelenchoides fujianensis]
MTRLLTHFFLVCLLISVFLPRTTAIWCWYCKDNSHCEMPTRMKCEDGESCKKVCYGNGTVHKGCYEVTGDRVTEEGCHQENYDKLKCICSKEFCNDGSSLLPSTYLLSLSVLASFLSFIRLMYV